MKQSSKVNLIVQQKSLLKKIFNQGENLWKILIFDSFNREINSSLLKMKDLRQSNITLYFNLKENRQQLHGVTAIYLVQPLIQNVQIITQDFQQDLYSHIIIHFSSEPSSHLLNTFAKNLVKKKSGCLSRISKVEYSCIGLHVADSKMAILPQNNEILNLLYSLKAEPIFVFGQKEEPLAYHLKERMKESEYLTKALAETVGKPTYTLVFLFNRDMDYFPVLSHGITYGSLIENIYQFTPTGHKIIKSSENQQEIDLNDQIWSQGKHLMISEMELEKEFNKIKTKLSNLNSKMDQYSELTEQNKKIQMHLNNAEHCIKEAKKRRLNQYHDLQNQIYLKKALNSEMLSLIRDLLLNSTDSDKVRLMLIILISCQHINSKQIDELESVFPEIQKNALYTSLKQKVFKSEGDDKLNNSKKYLKKFAKGIWSNLVAMEKKYVLTRYVEKIESLKEAELKELNLSMTTLGEQLNAETRISNVVVYCQGGICLNEYTNLKEFRPDVIYTGDRFINAADLI